MVVRPENPRNLSIRPFVTAFSRRGNRHDLLKNRLQSDRRCVNVPLWDLCGARGERRLESLLALQDHLG